MSSATAKADLTSFGISASNASVETLSGNRDDKNTLLNPNLIAPKTSEMMVGKSLSYNAPPYSLTVLRIKTGK